MLTIIQYNGPATFVSVEHTKRRSYTNAMTVWVESWYNGWYVCVRELQNFDGKHEGIKLVRMIYMFILDFTRIIVH